MRCLWIDCSFVADNPFLRTGIQRCVRELASRYVQHPPEGFDSVGLLKLDQTRILELSLDEIHVRPPRAKPVRRWQPPVALDTYLHNLSDAGLHVIGALLPFIRWQRFWWNPASKRGFRGGLAIIWHCLKSPQAAFRLIRGQVGLRALLPLSTSDFQGYRRDFDLDDFNRWADRREVDADDVLLMLDSSWTLPIWNAVDGFQARGTRVVSVIYDLIPVLHPKWCADDLARAFRDWLDHTLEHSDGALTISNTVSADVKSYLSFARPKHQHIPLASFYLGSDFQMMQAAVGSPADAQLFEHPTFLVVGTIEPRKNHAFILDAFEALWQAGHAINLLFVGRPGWKTEALIHRMVSHPMHNHRFYYWPGASDSQLAFAYANATALIFASQSEGFGLPLMEALVARLPVIASDLPIHREVGGDALHYVSLDDPEMLKEAVLEMIERADDRSTVPLSAPGLIDWDTSAKQLAQALQTVLDAKA